MGLGSQVDGVVACDADGRAAAPGDHLAGQAGHQTVRPAGAAVGAESLAERTGLVADASHSAPKMMWIRDNEPQVWQDDGRCWPRSGSYVLHHLSGFHAQDAANASSTMVYDVADGDFDDGAV